MGLDMYLTAKRFIWYDDKELAEAINKAAPCPISTTPNYVIYEVAYWRKANHIHKWFVDNVQDGNDDCGDYYVSKKSLTELRDLCNTVLKTAKLVPGGKIESYMRIEEDGKWTKEHEDVGQILNEDEIAELLPTTEGFFFGETGYNKYYLKDVQYTKDILDKILAANMGHWKFEYYSSW